MDISFTNRLATFCFACYVIANSLCIPFGAIGLGGILPIIMAISVGGVIVATKGQTLKNIQRSQIVFVLILLLFMFFSYIFAPGYGVSEVVRSFRFFVSTCILSLFVINYNFSFEYFSRCILILTIPITPFAITGDFSVIAEGVTTASDEWMGFGYSVLPLMVLSMYYLFEGEKKTLKLLSIVLFIALSLAFIPHASRGAILSLVMSLAYFLYSELQKRGVRKKTIWTIIIILLIAVGLFSQIVLSYIEDVVERSGIYSLSKFFTREDVSNGRFDLYSLAWKGIISSPLWGNGIASFNNYETYPHNIVIQMLYEGGIALFLLLVKKIIVVFKVITTKLCTYIDPRFLIFFFFTSFIELFFSSSFWEKQRFWMMIWLTYSVYNSNYKNSWK